MIPTNYSDACQVIAHSSFCWGKPKLFFEENPDAGIYTHALWTWAVVLVRQHLTFLKTLSLFLCSLSMLICLCLATQTLSKPGSSHGA